MVSSVTRGYSAVTSNSIVAEAVPLLGGSFSNTVGDVGAPLHEGSEVPLDAELRHPLHLAAGPAARLPEGHPVVVNGADQG